MTWMTVGLAGLIAIVALLYVFAPLLRPGPATRLVDDDRLTDLLGRKDAVVRTIKELEFDYHVGKLNDEDYARLNERMRRQAIGLLQQIEKLAPATASLDEQLEVQIAALRKTMDGWMAADAHPTAAGSSDDMVIAGVAQKVGKVPSSSRGDMQARFCTNCGGPVDAAHKFCANCGTPVTEVAEAAH